MKKTDLSKVILEPVENPPDCEVCEKLIANKHKHFVLWKVACVILAALVAVLAFMYFSNNVVNNETNITSSTSGNQNTVEGDGGIIVGSNNSSINQTVNEKDNTPIIVISIICGTAVAIVGMLVYTNYRKKK